MRAVLKIGKGLVHQCHHRQPMGDGPTLTKKRNCLDTAGQWLVENQVMVPDTTSLRLRDIAE